MSTILEEIKALKRGRLLHLENLPVPDDYRGRKTDELIDFAERFERLREAAKAFEMAGDDDGSIGWREAYSELMDAIEEAEKL